MAFLAHNFFYFLAIGLLLILSGLFSGAETVLFSLSRHDRLRMRKSPNALEQLAVSLVDRPRSLLTTLLIGNMTCNTLIFVLSTLILANGIAEPTPASASASTAAGILYKLLIAAAALIPPVLVTYVSDVFPKVVATLNNTRLAPLIALPIATLVRLLFPVSQFIDLVFLRPIHRLATGRRRAAKAPAFSAEELRELLEMSEAQGVIDITENELLQEVVRIGELRVRDVMTPRVDMVAHNINDPLDTLLAKFRASHLTKMPVYDAAGIDNILGLIYAKEILLAIPPFPARGLDVPPIKEAGRGIGVPPIKDGGDVGSAFQPIKEGGDVPSLLQPTSRSPRPPPKTPPSHPHRPPAPPRPSPRPPRPTCANSSAPSSTSPNPPPSTASSPASARPAPSSPSSSMSSAASSASSPSKTLSNR